MKVQPRRHAADECLVACDIHVDPENVIAPATVDDGLSGNGADVHLVVDRMRCRRENHFIARVDHGLSKVR